MDLQRFTDPSGLNFSLTLHGVHSLLSARRKLMARPHFCLFEGATAVLFRDTLPPTNMEVQKALSKRKVVFLQGSVHPTMLAGGVVLSSASLTPKRLDCPEP